MEGRIDAGGCRNFSAILETANLTGCRCRVRGIPLLAEWRVIAGAANKILIFEEKAGQARDIGPLAGQVFRKNECIRMANGPASNRED